MFPAYVTDVFLRVNRTTNKRPTGATECCQWNNAPPDGRSGAGKSNLRVADACRHIETLILARHLVKMIWRVAAITFAPCDSSRKLNVSGIVWSLDMEGSETAAACLSFIQLFYQSFFLQYDYAELQGA